MNARAQAQCTPSCARYRSMFSPEGMAAGKNGPFCAAFPDGIPDDIWENRFDHRQPHEGDHGLQWESAGGLAYPTYAFAMTEDAASPTIVAAADVFDGAMIALVPSPADLERLAIPGGEPIEQLYLTLLFLGDAAAIDQATRDELIAWAQDTAVSWDPIEADGFAPAWFNPTGDEPCLTLLCSGADLAEMHETVVADAADIDLDLPAQHEPWIPHVTLAYIDNDPESGGAMAVFDQYGISEGQPRTGLIVFDRIRLAFGGEVTDVPLGSSRPAAVEPPQVVEEVGADLAAAYVAGAREVWDGPLH